MVDVLVRSTKYLQIKNIVVEWTEPCDKNMHASISDMKYYVTVSIQFKASNTSRDFIVTYVVCKANAGSSGWNFGSKIPIYLILGYGEAPPPPDWNLDRTWSSEFWLSHPPWKLKFGQDLALWVLTTPVYTPRSVRELSYVETNFCIPHGYHLVLFNGMIGHSNALHANDHFVSCKILVFSS